MTYSVRSINRQDETTTVSLATLSSNALQLFANLAIIVSNGAEAQINPTELNIEQEHERLVLWVSNLGATHLGHSSLDYRLREADLVRNAIGAFLKDLCNSLLECREFLLYGDLSAMDDVNASGHNEGAYNYRDQPMTAIQQSMLEADYGSETTGSVEQEFNLILESITETINCLYRIATRIRNPATRTLTKKVLEFKMTDRESGVDLVGQYASLDREHLREVFKAYRSADILNRFEEQETSPQNLDSARREPLEFLAHRLAQANTLRRKQFAYWSRHRKKLDAASEATAQAIHVQQVQPRRASQTVFSTAHDRSVVPSLPTTATTLDPAKFDLGDTKSVVTISDYGGAIFSSSSTRRDVIQIPNPPSKAKGQRYFECPYCLTLCSGAYLERRSWRSHVLRDLRPYVCTYQDCSEATQLFERRQDWIAHEDSCHRRIWRCLEHPETTFPTVAAYKHHIREFHVSNCTELESIELLRVGESVPDVADRPCPICLSSISDAITLQQHIAAHLLRIALFSLPRSTGADDDVESGTSWSGRARGHHSDSSQEISNDSSISSTQSREDDMRSFNNEQWGHGNALSQNALRHLGMIMSEQGSNTKVGQYLSRLVDSEFQNQWLNQDLSSPRQATRLDDDVASPVKYEASSSPHNSARLAKELADDRNSRGDSDSADLDDLTPELDKLKAPWEERDEARGKPGSQQRYSNIELNRGSLPLESSMLSGEASPDSATTSVTLSQIAGKRASRQNFQAPESPHEPEHDFPCTSCGEILEVEKAFGLAGNRWHLECFRCNTCNTLLDTNAKLLLLGDRKLICNNCTYSCSKCGNKIEGFGILTGDQAFCEKCFTCRNCKRKIEDLGHSRTAQGLCMPCYKVTPTRYEYFVFSKVEDWRVADMVQVPAPQEELERKVAKGNKTNSVLEAVEKMSPDRRSHIIRLLYEKNLANEHGDAEWQCVLIDSPGPGIKMVNGKTIREHLRMDVIIAKHILPDEALKSIWIRPLLRI